MKLVIFPDDGQPHGQQFFDPVPLDWHKISLEIKRQAEEKGWSVHVYPDVPKGNDVLAIYNGIPETYKRSHHRKERPRHHGTAHR